MTTDIPKRSKWRGKDWGSMTSKERRNTVIGCLAPLLLCGLCGVFISRVPPPHGSSQPTRKAGMPTATSRAVEKFVTRADFGEKWPFTVNAGSVVCDMSLVTFLSGRERYALNFPGKNGVYASVEEIRATNPAIPDTKIGLGPIIDFGLSLCR